MKLNSHKAKPTLTRRRGGFTLIEIIATLVLSAILVSLMLPLIGSSLQGSRRTLLRIPATYSLRTEMDTWWQTYRSTDPTDLPALQTAINAAAAGAPYTVESNDWVDFDEFELFAVEKAAAGTQNVLRVTLRNSQGERLTTYFFPILFP